MRDAATIGVPVPRVGVDPHRQLMAAVLQTVVDDCWDAFGTLAAGRRARDARIYVLSKDRGWPFSFENLCNSLDLDACELRQALLRVPKAATVRPNRSVTTEQILD